MSDKKSTIDSIEDKVKNAARDVEDFADKVAADEEPNVVENKDELSQAGRDRPKKN